MRGHRTQGRRRMNVTVVDNHAVSAENEVSQMLFNDKKFII